MLQKRIRKLNNIPPQAKAVIYWMSRDQRSRDNWALVVAQNAAIEMKVPLVVVFCLQSEFLLAGKRQFDFMLSGLTEVSSSLAQLNIPFLLQSGKPQEVLPKLIDKLPAGLVVSDFSPLRIAYGWYEQLAAQLDVALWQVDTHNIVPAWVASSKQEFAAHTFRPKILSALSSYLTPIPALQRHPYSVVSQRLLSSPLPVITSLPIQTPGTNAGMGLYRAFTAKLANYALGRNDPNQAATSGLSAYLHFGQISAQRLAYELYTGELTPFLEQLIVRRELAENFCLYNRQYDSTAAFPSWSQQSLDKHQKDKRDYLYSLEEFEQAKTHDPLWNAAQRQMLTTGYMHNYMRMYWAKKILEWTNSADQAMQVAVYLNDKYQLDGRDPNGYAGIAWSIGGVHDRPWFERKVYGQIRYMNASGAARKFDTKQYVTKYS